MYCSSILFLKLFSWLSGKLDSEAKTPASQNRRTRGGGTTGRKRRDQRANQTPSDSQNPLDASLEKSRSSKKGRPKRKVPAPILFSSDEDSDDVFAPPREKEDDVKGIHHEAEPSYLRKMVKHY